MFRHRLILILGVLFLTCCSPSVPQVEPDPTPQVVRLQITPDLIWLKQGISFCASEVPQFTFVVEEAPVSRIAVSQAEIILRWGVSTEAPENSYVLGEEELLVIVHPDNPLTELTRDQVQAVFRGDIRLWQDLLEAAALNSIQVLIYPPEDAGWQVFSDSLFENQLPYLEALLVPDAASLRSVVAADPATIGLLPSRWLDASVRPLSVIGSPPMRQPILAVTPDPPSRDTQNFLLCLQDYITHP